ncbi:MAG: Unknown protein [uncultured Sulfurovum sp.]|uniref:Rhodanese domain-containing protein n=1 Tax=uncultured Sulfurovum sp. TaxID=269237 RepID=A0A6S6T961_9BACT|nr:MAG: Unknown protein [uncultured Sulfurovum sp.]
MRVKRLIIFMILLWTLLGIIMGERFLSHAYKKGWILANFDSIGAKRVSLLLQKKDTLNILDVRTINEYKHRHLKNAIHIPLTELSEKIHQLKVDKSKPIIVYCKSGSRSVKASRILADNGYHPLNVQGGIRQLMRNHVELSR